jgi:hypothetical protein
MSHTWVQNSDIKRLNNVAYHDENIRGTLATLSTLTFDTERWIPHLLDWFFVDGKRASLPAHGYTLGLFHFEFVSTADPM